MHLWCGQAKYSSACPRVQAEVSEGIYLRAVSNFYFFRPKQHACAVMLMSMFCSIEDPGNAGSRLKVKNKESRGKEDHTKQFRKP